MLERDRKSDAVLADRPARALIGEPELIGGGFRRLERFAVELTQPDGSTAAFSRDLLTIGRTVAIIAIDPARDEIVLIRQFRLAAHRRMGAGDLIEVPAGYVDPGEAPSAAAHRECIEEIGVAPRFLREIFTFMPAPGILDEHATIFLAAVDAAGVPEQAGATYEIEHTHPIRVPIDDALSALQHATLHNGYLIICLQWIALNRDRLPELLRQP